MRFRIPTEFKMYATRVRVVRTNPPGSTDVAQWDPKRNKICISPDEKDGDALHDFFHEFMHAAFEKCGYEKLSEDEQLVDAVGGLLAQMIDTGKNA